MTTRIKILLGALLIVVIGGGTAFGISSSHTSAAHNAADIAFAQDMIPHHRQAVEMAQYVATRSTNPQVVLLAKQIEDAQGPEITTMTGWLSAWKVAVPTSNAGHATMPGMQGMMSDADMATLRSLSGTAFDKMWLSMMTDRDTNRDAASGPQTR